MNLELIAKTEANEILRQHYLGPTTYPPYFCLATSDRSALAVYGAPVASSFKREGGKANGKPLNCVLELTRLWVDTEAPFDTSQFLAASLRWINANGYVPEKRGNYIVRHRCRCVVSYADPRVNHRGTIYQATNFVHLGQSTVTDTFLVPPEGSTVVDQHGKEHHFTGGTRVTLPKCYRLWKTKTKTHILEHAPTWKDLQAAPKEVYLYPFLQHKNANRRAKELMDIIALFPRYAKQHGKRQPKRGGMLSKPEKTVDIATERA